MQQKTPDVVMEFTAFIEEFKLESDRAIVVLTAARLDFLLFAILQKYLVPNASRTDEFFENQGPGSGFSNKIMLTYRLGLIDRDFARALNLVRNIRNDFAHETSACSLEKGSHKDRVRALAAPYTGIPFFPWFKGNYFKDVGPSRADYMTVVGFLIVRLSYLFEGLQTINSQEAWPVVTPAMRQPMDSMKQQPQSGSSPSPIPDSRKAPGEVEKKA